MTNIRKENDVIDIEFQENEKRIQIEEEEEENEELENYAELDEGKEIHGSFMPQRRFVANILNYLLTRVTIVLLIFLDVIFVIISVAISYSSDDASHITNAFDVISLLFTCIFLLELLLRMFVELLVYFIQSTKSLQRGICLFLFESERFAKSWYNVADGVIITLSFIITAILFAVNASSSGNQSNLDIFKLIAVGRIIRLFLLVRSIRILLQSEGLQKAMRLCVRGNKRGYQKDGYDLDLCYVTPRVIAMSFPSSGMEGAYRNRIEHVAKFLDEKHRDAYRVYNLCSEKSYETSHFHDSVMRFYIDDHNVPTLRDAVKFAKNVKEWMDANPNNTIAIHCKGGKGRTGTMICIWLLESKACTTATQALEMFGARRTDLGKGAKFQGVETPSQSRFVSYYEQILYKFNGQLPEKKILKLEKIVINSIKSVGSSNGSDFSFTVYTEGKKEAGHCNMGNDTNCKRKFENLLNRVVVENIVCEPFYDEVKIMFCSTHKSVPKYYDNCAFFFSFHTSFIDPATNTLKLGRNDLDNPHREKFWNVWPETFSVECYFSSV